MFEQRVELGESVRWIARWRKFYAEGTDRADTHLACSSNTKPVCLEKMVGGVRR